MPKFVLSMRRRKGGFAATNQDCREMQIFKHAAVGNNQKSDRNAAAISNFLYKFFTHIHTYMHIYICAYKCVYAVGKDANSQVLIKRLPLLTPMS